jgi:perosamine synthetase
MIPVIRPWLGPEEAEAAAAVVASGWVAQGPRVAEFEARFAAATNARHAVAVSSCTAALHLALVVAGVGPDDEVIVPSLSFIATTNAARYVGATPVFADVDPMTQNLTPESVEPHLTEHTRSSRTQHARPALHIVVDPRGRERSLLRSPSTLENWSLPARAG